MKLKTKGILNGITASASYGTNPLFALPLYHNGIGMNSILFYRYFLAVVIYGMWLKLVKKTSFKITAKEFFTLLFMGLLFSFSSLTLFESFKYIESGTACTILFIYPVLVVIIMAAFFKEKITPKVIISVLLTLTGVLMLYNGNSTDALNLKGVGIVLLSVVFYAFYIVGIKTIKTIKHIKPDKLNFYVMLSGLVVYVVNLKFCTQLQIIDKPLLWLSAIALALIPTIISIETINVAIKLAGPVVTSILGALEPLTAVFFGVLIFNEHLTVKLCCGIFLILSGVLLVATKK